MLDETGAAVDERAFRHDAAGLAALCNWLVSTASDVSVVLVATEVSHRPVLDTLLDRGFAMYDINPNSSTACANALAWPVPKATGATPKSRPPDSAPTCPCSGT